MISGRLSKGAGSALFSRVFGASHPGRDVVLFYIISCFCTYYEGKLGYIYVSFFLRIWIVFIIIQHSLAKYVIRLLIGSNTLDIG